MHGTEVKTATAPRIAGGSFVAGVVARPLLRWTPLMVAAPTIAVGWLMLARGVWLLVQLRRRG